MYRATTPTHKFCFGEVDPEGFKEIRITYVQNGGIVFEKTKDDLAFGIEDADEGTHYHASLRLSQEETSRFKPIANSYVSLQIRACDYDGNVVASDILKIPLLDVLNDEVLE